MSSGSKKLYEGNAFDEDSVPRSSNEVTISGSPIPTHSSTDDLFDEIDKYCENDPTTVIDLLDEIDDFWGNNTDTAEPADVEVKSSSNTIGLEEPIVTTIHSCNMTKINPK